jgi:predicted nucleotidyltransferase
MSNLKIHKKMISLVADALGDELLDTVAFVGGCTTGFFLTDEYSRELGRHTEDVDLIINIAGKLEWSECQNKLRERGFKDDMSNNAPICALNLGSLRVDFMPDDPDILGFSNRWYRDALFSATKYPLLNGKYIRLILPVYFIGTKLEAYLSRGNNNVLESRDIEDVLVVFNGREEIVEEIINSPDNLYEFIKETLTDLIKHNQFEYAVYSAAENDRGREELIFERIDNVIQGKK